MDSQPRTVDVGESVAFGHVDIPVGEPLEDLLERDASLEPGQRRAEAVVGADAERRGADGLRGGCRKRRRRAGIGDGRGWPRRSASSSRCPRARSGRRTRRRGSHTGPRAAPAARSAATPRSPGNQRRVLDELAPLVGVLGEHLARPADQPRGGLVARAGHDVEVGQQFVAASACGSVPVSSSNSTLSSSVMMSSDGCSARQSM